MATAGTIEVFLTANAAGMESALRRAESRLDKAERRMQDFGASMTAGVTLPIVGAGAAAGVAAVSIENAMTGVAKTVDAPQEEINALREEFEAMSEEIPVSTQELARMGQVAGQLGVPVDQIRDFVETTAALKVSTDLGAEEAAIEVARLNNVMGEGKDEADRTGSALVALGNNIEAMEGEILRTTTFFRTMASSAGASTAEVLGLAGALRRAGVRAQAGGSGIMVTFQEMQKAVEGVSGELDTFAAVADMSGEEFAGLFERDATEALLRFLEGLERMQESGQGMNQVLDQLGLSGRRVTRALGGLSADTDKTREAVEIATEAYEENVALVEEAQKFYDRLGADFKTFANEAVNTAAALGRELAPSFRDMLDAGRAVLDVFAGLVKMFASLPTAVQALAIGMAGLAASLGPVAFGLSQILSVGSSLAGALAGGAGLVGALGGLGPVLAGVAALVATGGTLVMGFQALQGAIGDTGKQAETAQSKVDRLTKSIDGLTEAQREAFASRINEQLAVGRRRMEVLGGLIGRKGSTDEIVEVVAATKQEAVELAKRFEEVRFMGGRTIQAPMHVINRLYNKTLERVQQLERLKSELQSAGDTGGGSAGSAGGVQVGGGEELTDREKALATLRRQVQTTREQEALLGDRFDHNAELARVYRQNIQSLLDAGFKPQSDAVRNAVSEYLQYQRAVEKSREAQERQRKEQRRVNRAVQTANSLLRSSRSPMERHQRRLERINTALEENRINEQQANRARTESRRQMREAQKEMAEGTEQELQSEMESAGRSAVQALVSGFIRGADNLGDRLENAALSLVEQFVTAKIVGFLGIASPSTVAMGWGESLVEGFARGIEGHSGRLDRAVGSTFSISGAGAFSGPGGLTGATSRIQPARPDVSDLPDRPFTPVTPREQALDSHWQRTVRESLRVARDQGFGGS